ncbi:hypothetical protein NBH19_22610 [Rhizobium sp. S95]|uniref:Uncharacterized protein n=1 Tax=Ciceribacter sichuanensis TaxID=2949647 RepID=A0AAJ1F6P0_9HYPH|nr:MULTISPECIES: hypothetical protein [unclassified Ciceribacter]MCM2398877.1 hypothetical protein [Ciceribacter sp. S95]MCM2403529.1 hypothetical protein [Ciceribacter sp. S153]MCO5956917.1 hypothetical protein [Ciceribacter sp. S101]
MPDTSSVSVPPHAAADRALEAPEFIDRLAEELRASSDIDLPHAYFVEQVKLGLSGRELTDVEAANDIEGYTRPPHARVAASVFNCWAMPE